MAIYRGTGGAGDATNDATVTEVTQQAVNAANSATEAATSATTASTKASEASASATTASTKASEASTSATNAATSATEAETAKTAAETAQTAAETAKTGAETAKTNAETAQTAAETAETNAATSETNAANSATSASTSATTATTKASEAATSATNAATSATNASTSATAAQTAQTAAETAQAAAEAAQEAIDGLYLGTNTTNPTVDLNGNAVTVGDWYFNTTDNTTRIYDGTNWNTVNPDLVGDTTPQLGGDLDTNGNNVNFGDNDKAQFGAGNDLQIYHDGSNSYVTDSGTGGLYLRGSNEIALRSASNENIFLGLTDGSAYVYHNGSAKLATTSTGVDVTGTVTADGLTVDGNVTATGDFITDEGKVKAERVEVENDTGPNMYATAYGTGSTTYTWFEGTGDNKLISWGNNGDISFYDDDGSTVKFRWDASTNRLGIGTSSPGSLLEVAGASPVVEINSTSGNPELQFSDGGTDEYSIQFDTGSDSLRFVEGGVGTRMLIDSSGNVGIGTSSPQKELHVNNNASESVILVDSSDTGNAGIYFGGQTDTIKAGLILDNSDNSLDIRGFNNSTAATVSSSLDWHFANQLYIPDYIYHSGDSNTYLQFHGDDKWRVVTGTQERIEVSNDGIIINENGNATDFRVESDGNQNMLLVDGSANRVGIGTSSPTHTLEVASSSPVVSTKDTNGSGSSATGWIEWNGSDGNRLGYVGYGSTGNDDLYIRQELSGHIRHYVNGTERLRITDDGNINVGTKRVFSSDSKLQEIKTTNGRSYSDEFFFNLDNDWVVAELILTNIDTADCSNNHLEFGITGVDNNYNFKVHRYDHDGAHSINVTEDNMMSYGGSLYRQAPVTLRMTRSVSGNQNISFQCFWPDSAADFNMNSGSALIANSTNQHFIKFYTQTSRNIAWALRVYRDI